MAVYVSSNPHVNPLSSFHRCRYNRLRVGSDFSKVKFNLIRLLTDTRDYAEPRCNGFNSLNDLST